jgi:hypothetical protein
VAVSDQDRQGAAYHEAGHVVVAWALGLPVGEITIGMNGDDAAGLSEIGESDHLPIIDRIAICQAGLEAQELFDSHTHDLAGMSDYAKIIELVGDETSENESKRLRDAGSARARDLLIKPKEQVSRLAEAVVLRSKIDAATYLSGQSRPLPA